MQKKTALSNPGLFFYKKLFRNVLTVYLQKTANGRFRKSLYSMEKEL